MTIRPARSGLPLAILALAVTAMAGPAFSTTAGPAAMHGVPNPAQARIDYMLKCQGCHQPNGSGNAVNTPPLRNEVARFLHVPGGREFLGRVPGVASTDLPDDRLTQLLNWTLYRFDNDHLPQDFKPYTVAEVAGLRHQPLRLERAPMRARLVAQIDNQRNSRTNQDTGIMEAKNR
jgi:hypothetical protein